MWAIPASAAVGDVQGKALRVAFTLRVPGEAWCLLCKLAFAVSASLIHLPSPSCLKSQHRYWPSALRRDVIHGGDRPTRSSPHTRGCVQPTKGTGFPKFLSFPGHVVPHSLQTGAGGLDFMTHIQVCDCFLFYFTAKGSGKDQ